MNRRTVDTRLSSAPTHLIKREPGNEATGDIAIPKLFWWNAEVACIMISPASFLSACGTIATPKTIHCALAVLRTSQSHLETEESLCPIPLATQLQDSKLCLDGSFSSKFLFGKQLQQSPCNRYRRSKRSGRRA